MQAKKWINLGFNPTDYEVVSFVKNKLDYNAEDIPIGNSNLKTFSLNQQEVPYPQILTAEN
ncbi:6285_t:CDS:2 [Funneliformis geosporum]|uniref:6285_t:CDS:1 n=1 Tax=Funneliformis geosporum TaxID=1117311 RepID=A0A9W4WPT0_9GLOM|nr:6285_t:CDS:2 [Funneliformis geosporum]